MARYPQDTIAARMIVEKCIVDVVVLDGLICFFKESEFIEIGKGETMKIKIGCLDT